MENINYVLAGRHEGMDLLIKKAENEKIYDVKKGEYIDYVLGNLTQIFGHRGIDMEDVIREVAGTYYNVGDNPNIHGVELAKKILEISNMDMMRFTNSGSEAVHLALRVARAHTGRNKVLKFVGHYHGWFDEPISTFLGAKVTEGVCPEITDNIIMVQWNDKQAVSEAFEKYGDYIAAVILEPVLAHSGTIPPFQGFLDFLREITTQNKAVLIFDECVTGFRIALGGAQEFYYVQADLVIYSKAISGGIPIGVLAGKEMVMKCLQEGRVYQASTYDSNPLSAAVALKIINTLQSQSINNSINAIGNKLMDGMKNVFEINGHKALFQGVGAFYQFYFTQRDQITSYSEAMQTDWKKFQRFICGMRKKNICMSEGELWSDNYSRNWIGSVFVSTGHSDESIQKTLNAASAVLKELA